MEILAALISAALCALLYVRMVRREKPEPMPKKREKGLRPLWFRARWRERA